MAGDCVHNQLKKELFANESHQHQCEHCGRRFTAHNHLETHILCHHSQTKFLPPRETMSLNINQDVRNDIEIIQEVIVEDQNQALYNLNTNTAENICDGEVKIEPSDYNLNIDKEEEQNQMCMDSTTTEVGVNIGKIEIKVEPIDCQDETTRSNKSWNFSQDVGINIEIKQEVISEEESLSLDTIHTNTEENICDGDIKIEFNYWPDVTTDAKCVDSSITVKQGSLIDENICDIKRDTNLINLQKNFAIKEQTGYCCELCKKTVPTLTSFHCHMKVHAGKKLFSCDICHKNFKRSADMRRHMRVHIGEEPYTCDICCQKFSQSAYLRRHMTIHTMGKPYICDICHKKFARSTVFQHHMKAHTGEKPYNCDTCDQKLICSAHFRDHERVHTGDNTYICKICHKKFLPGHLRDHMKVHTGEKPFNCNICEKKFTRSTHLRDHMRVHTGEKPFSCDTCDKQFSQMSTLRQHMRTHTYTHTFIHTFTHNIQT